jgi:hypothetical protein
MFASITAAGSPANPVSHLLCFDIHAKPFSRIPFPLITIQNRRGGGWGFFVTQPLTPFASSAFALLLHYFAAEHSSSLVLSITSALFAQTPGVYPSRQEIAAAKSCIAPLTLASGFSSLALQSFTPLFGGPSAD